MTAPTVYHLRNESGIEVFTGTIYPAPGGGSQPDVTEFPFAFGDAGLAAGLVFYTPTADDVAAGLWLLDAWFEIDTAWDGTTPFGDIGKQGWTFGGLFSATIGASGVDMTQADQDGADYGYGGAGLLFNPNGAPPLAAAGVSAAYDGPPVTTVGLEFRRIAPVRITNTTPLTVWVSQNGNQGGSGPVGAQGAGKLCYRIGKA